ncbi:MAG: histidine kinase [Desulfobulbaceae bacterium]|nr:MAG: histidine kinase [Desulfobulbaceae bacterium]
MKIAELVHGLPHGAFTILESMADGVYVTDHKRRILYWNPAAERITGWSADRVVGRPCSDNFLCHEDSAGTPLCEEEHCPLHRAMLTGIPSTEPIQVFAHCRDGSRLAVQVNVAPVRNATGEVIGGVEIFRDVSPQMRDLQYARAIQAQAMQLPAKADPRLSFAVRYQPHGLVGGDFCTVERLDADRYVFFIADVMGHGVQAALYTMHLHALWESNRRLLARPASFFATLNQSLCRLFQRGQPFAHGTFGLIDLASRGLILVNAGGPPMLLSTNNDVVLHQFDGLPLGMDPEFLYETQLLPLAEGDGLLFCTDGLLKIPDRHQRSMGAHGLARLVEQRGFPADEEALSSLYQEILQRSNLIALGDDCTILAISLHTEGR